MKLENTSTRTLSVPTPVEMTVLKVGESFAVSDAELRQLRRNSMIRNWIHRGVLTVKEGPEKPPTIKGERGGPELPEGLTGEGTEVYHHGGGWYSVYHAGMPCTDEKVRKDRAEEIAKDYE